MSYYRSRSRYHSNAEPSAAITSVNGYYVVKSSYNESLVAFLKGLPLDERAYVGDTKAWEVDARHASGVLDAIKRYLGLDVTLPALSVPLPERTETTEVRYLGGAYARNGSAVRTASGYVKDTWKLVFTEAVLRKWFGEGEAKPNTNPSHYGILGISQSASDDEIKKAYRKMAKIWHPDVSKEPDADRQFKAIGHAYAILSDDIKRQKYDAGLRLQAQVGGQRESTENVYFSPLRCGVITALMKPITGSRYLVVHISKWEDIVVNGRMLVPTWPKVSDHFIEQWMEVVR